ncbi:MAG: hypothetical protein QM648_11070 [Solirubrobacterales bacterium]
MGIQHSLRRINLSHAILITGLVAGLLVIMFRPAGAVADLPTNAKVFTKYSDTDPSTVSLSSLSKVTRDYDVIPTNKSKSVSSSLTGVPLVEFLRKVDTDLDGVGFVKVRLNVTDDSRIALVPLGDLGAERPPMVLASGKVGSRSLGTPALVPGQPDDVDAIKQDNIVTFSKSQPYIQIVPSKPGAKLISVKINKSKKSNGQYNLSASITNGTKGAAVKYQWFQTDAKGNQVAIGTNKSVTTSATGTKDVVVSVVATETESGSTGQQYMSYIPKSSDKGSTKDPGTGTGSNGSGSGSGSGTGLEPARAPEAAFPAAINTTPTPYTPRALKHRPDHAAAGQSFDPRSDPVHRHRDRPIQLSDHQRRAECFRDRRPQDRQRRPALDPDRRGQRRRWRHPAERASRAGDGRAQQHFPAGRQL